MRGMREEVGMSTTQEMVEAGRGECTCHIAPPCQFCISMDEDEDEAWLSNGLQGLEQLWDERKRRQRLAEAYFSIPCDDGLSAEAEAAYADAFGDIGDR